VIDRVLGNSGHIRLYSGQFPAADIDSLIEELEARSDVETAMPIVEGAVLASSSAVARGAYVRGIRPDDTAALPYLQGDLYDGSMESFGDGRFGGDNIIVSERLARSLYVGAGDTLTLIAPEGAATMGGVVPRRKVYTIAGVFEVFSGNANPLDDSLIIMPLEQAQLFFNSRSSYPKLQKLLSDRRAEAFRTSGRGHRKPKAQQGSPASRYAFSNLERALSRNCGRARG